LRGRYNVRLVRREEQAIGDEVFGRRRNGIYISLVITVALLQRQAGIATREALSLGSGKGEKAAGQVTKIAFTEAGSPIVPRDICADRGAYRDRADPRNVETVSVNARQFVGLATRALAVGIPLSLADAMPSAGELARIGATMPLSHWNKRAA